ncbi:MAG TPA: glycoside hydrolase family 16 protein [Candidatus Binatus sp.]|nr:glycoside hydrolase family 16 protein [Candidatus Binatus sp.]
MAGGSSSPLASSPYTFDDEFDQSSLSPMWGQHLTCCGQVASVDAGLASVGNGLLTLTLQRQADGWHGSLVDTLGSWRQAYGYFAARIKIPSGAGLWPAFWSYAEGGDGEIDAMEVCGNPIGTHGGDDVSLLHTTVHWEGGSSGHDTRTVDLSQAFHVYAVDWRPSSLTFYLDGQVVWTYTNAAHIPNAPLPLILDLGVGGTWCGAPTASSPSTATMQVDWVRAAP